jgi:hypothetical protein
MLALAIGFLLLTAVTFALLAYDTGRTGRQTAAALLAGGAWLIVGIGLICVVNWIWS